MMHGMTKLLIALCLGGCGAWWGTQLAGAATPARRLTGKTDNYARLGGDTFRFHSALYYWPATDATTSSSTAQAVSLPLADLYGTSLPLELASDQLRVVTLDGAPVRYCVVRVEGGRSVLLPAAAAVRPGDRLIAAVDRAAIDVTHCSVVLVVWGSEATENAAAWPSSYDPALAALDGTRIADERSLDASRGLLDYSGPIDRQYPAARIQMDAIFSARWRLWYEFAHWPEQAKLGNQGITLVPVPLNPLHRASDPANNSTQFNMDDVPRFPLYYARYIKATGDASAMPYLRAGLQTLIDYTRPDGTMPYLLAPWNGQHREGEAVFDLYHSLRAVAESRALFATEAEFRDRLDELYSRYRGFIMGHLREGLFQGRPEATGAVIEGMWLRWKDAHDPAALADIRTLADALASPQVAPRMHQEFGEYIPWVPIGLAAAYSAIGDASYLQAARLWVHQAILPSLLRDRRYYYVVPDFKPSGIDQPWGANPLQIWYHTDALLWLHAVTGSERSRTAAAWVFNDYYDQQRYGAVPQWHIIDTGDPWTEHWGAASAEDALRMMAKFLWQWSDEGLYQATRTILSLPMPDKPLF